MRTIAMREKNASLCPFLPVPPTFTPPSPASPVRGILLLLHSPTHPSVCLCLRGAAVVSPLRPSAADRPQRKKAFPDLFRDFLDSAGHSTSAIAVACLAVAGPVEANCVNFTNIDWKISGDELSKAFNIPTVVLINDFVATGYGLLTLDEVRRVDMVHGSGPMERFLKSPE